ncbi:DUF551 domain-containing protein [Agrobacterium sp. CMT1]|uniref:DUF551 domain-containing protein n=1 Tax=Agrobacterium sp. CMT1 TaxID=3128901 RepID=UPI0030779013
MQSEESNTLVKLAKAVIEHAPEGGDAFWGIKFSDIEAALSAAEPKPHFWDVEEARENKLATVVAPDNGTTAEVLSAVLECAEAWVPEARIIGNVRAGDIARVVRSALSAQVQDVAGWQPIESAPRDGTQFLAFEIDGYFNCWWHDNGYGEQYWMDEADSEPNPTHWMPLPAAPAKQEAGRVASK